MRTELYVTLFHVLDYYVTVQQITFTCGLSSHIHAYYTKFGQSFQVTTDGHYTSAQTTFSLSRVGVSHARLKVPKEIMKGSAQARKLPKGHTLQRCTHGGNTLYSTIQFLPIHTIMFRHHGNGDVARQPARLHPPLITRI